MLLSKNSPRDELPSAADAPPKINDDLPEDKNVNEEVQVDAKQSQRLEPSEVVDAQEEQTLKQACSEKPIIDSLPLKEDNTQLSSNSDQNADSKAEPSDMFQKEGGDAENDHSQDNVNLLALSLQKVRQNAAKQGQKRKLDPRKYSGVKSKVGKNVKVADKTSKQQLHQKYSELYESQSQAQVVVDFHKSLSGARRSETSSVKKSVGRRSPAKINDSIANINLNSSDALQSNPNTLAQFTNDTEVLKSVQVSGDRNLQVAAANATAVTVSNRREPSPKGMELKPPQPKTRYQSPYKKDKSRLRSPLKRALPQIDNPVMTFAKDSASPVRSITEMAGRLSPLKSATPASMRPKGSFMNPTESKSRKEVHKQDLIAKQSETIAERATLQKKRATDLHPYEKYDRAMKTLMSNNANEQSSPVGQNVEAELKQRSKRLQSASPKKHRKTKSKSGYKSKSRAPENPEQSDTPIVNIGVDQLQSQKLTGLEDVHTSETLLQKKYHQRGLSSGQNLRDEASRMEKEFYDIMNDLEQRRTNKNMDWYTDQLNADYAHMRKNLQDSTTESLVKKKGQNLIDQKASLYQMGPQKKITMDKNWQKLATESPLDFIDTVLAHKTQQN